MKNAVVRARIDADLKARAFEVLASCGLEVSDAIRLFLKQVIAHNGIPFPIHSVSPERSGAELAQLKQASQARDRRIGASDAKGKEAMFLVRPDQARAARIKWPKGCLK